MINRLIKAAVFIVVSAWISVGAGGIQTFAQSSKNEFMEIVATGETKEEAKANAVRDMLLNGLEAIVGDEAYGTIGDAFFATYGKSFKHMKRRFFTSDFSSECDQDSDGYRCLVEAELRFGALDRAAKNIINKNKKTAGSGRESNEKYNIIANTSVEKNRRNMKLLSLLKKVFTTYGHTFTYVDKFKSLDSSGIDFAIRFALIDFVGFKHNKYTKRFEGGIDITFELSHLSFSDNGSSLQTDSIASDVVTITTYVTGTNPDAMERELETRLINEASNRFVQNFNSNIEAFLAAQ